MQTTENLFILKIVYCCINPVNIEVNFVIFQNALALFFFGYTL